MDIAIYHLMLFTCLWRTDVIIVDYLLIRLCEISFIPFIWLDVMICLVIQIENYIYEVFFVEHLCVLGLTTSDTFGLPNKEPNLIIIVLQ